MTGVKIYVEVTGGLANQLFQWSVADSLAHQYSAELIVDPRVASRPWERGLQLDKLLDSARFDAGSRVSRAYWTSLATLGKYPRAIGRRLADGVPRLQTIVTTVEAARASLDRGRSIRMRGLFQDVAYIMGARDRLAQTVRAGLQRHVESAAIPTMPYAAWHVRRGDYAQVPEYLARFGLCSAAYFRASLDVIDPALPILIATDDPTWVLSEFADLESRARVFSGADQFADLLMLANASELVLSNSTFSWWGAFLGGQRTVVCPRPWFNNPADDQGIELDEWLRIDRD